MKGLKADARIKLALGTQFVEMQLMQDRIDELTEQLSEREAEKQKSKPKSSD